MAFITALAMFPLMLIIVTLARVMIQVILVVVVVVVMVIAFAYGGLRYLCVGRVVGIMLSRLMAVAILM
eukprot:9615114-Lingulodinium_polyedra.AAC.1